MWFFMFVLFRLTSLIHFQSFFTIACRSFSQVGSQIVQRATSSSVPMRPPVVQINDNIGCPKKPCKSPYLLSCTSCRRSNIVSATHYLPFFLASSSSIMERLDSSSENASLLFLDSCDRNRQPEVSALERNKIQCVPLGSPTRDNHSGQMIT